MERKLKNTDRSAYDLNKVGGFKNKKHDKTNPYDLNNAGFKKK